MTKENEHFGVYFKQIDTNRMKNMFHNWYKLTKTDRIWREDNRFLK